MLSNLILNCCVSCSPKIQSHYSFTAFNKSSSFPLQVLQVLVLFCLVYTFLPLIKYHHQSFMSQTGLHDSSKLKFLLFLLLSSLATCFMFPYFLLNILHLFIIEFNFHKTRIPLEQKSCFIFFTTV